MAQLNNAEDAIKRFKENENRVDVFVNDSLKSEFYQTNETPPRQVQTIPHFMEMLKLRYLALNYKGLWATSTTYEEDDLIKIEEVVYICIGAHVSTTFTNDLASKKWAVYQNKADFVSVKDFGAIGDGSSLDKTAIETAWASSKCIIIPEGEYNADGLVLNGSDYSNKRIFSFGAKIKGVNLHLRNLFGLQMDNITFEATSSIFLEGLRYNTWTNVNFKGLVKWGKWNEGVLSSYSTYWNNFKTCKFAGIKFKLSATSANFNSNTFDTCEFRPGSLGSLMEFYNTAANDGAFSSNTFIGCDTSYAPVLNIVDEYPFFAALFIGGYLDTGTPFYAPGSYKATDLDVIGLRNPSGHQIDPLPSANICITSGGGRPKRSLPVGALSFFKTETIPSNCTGRAIVYVNSAPLPYDGYYTITAIFDKKGGDFKALKFENLTIGAAADKYSILENDGISSYTFKASKGDLVRLVLDVNADTNTDILQLHLTSGAGVNSAVPYRSVVPFDQTSVVANNGVLVDLLSINPGSYKNAKFYTVEIFSINPIIAGGGEKITLQVGVATGGSSIAATVVELSRCSVNGPGGTSDDSGTLVISTTTSGTSLTIKGTLSGAPSSVTCNVKVKSDN